MPRSKKPWELLLLLALSALWHPTATAPTPCPPALKPQHAALSLNLRQTPHVPVWGERHGAKGEWVVVHYTVDGQGRTHDPELVDSSGGDPELVLEGVKACEPIPPAGKTLDVTELFWQDGSQPKFPAGSLAQQLYDLHEDGRWLR